MNLRNAKDYYIGLDIGTNSVGWSVVDAEGLPYSFKGKTAWGSRLFASAEHAADARVHRSQRRRYNRRRQRLLLLQGFFDTEMSKVDPEFFIKMRQSHLWPEDRNPKYQTGYQSLLFNDTDFKEADYHQQFPTIYHLRSHLCKSPERADIRLVYLALHHTLKYRGNFLREGETLKASEANASVAVEAFIGAIENYSEVMEMSFNLLGEDFEQALKQQGLSNQERKNKIEASLGAVKEHKAVAAEIAKAIIGHKVELSKVFEIEKSADTGFTLSSDEKVEAFYDLCVDDDMLTLYSAILALYKAFVLSEILAGIDGDGTLSDSMIVSYDKHKKDLAILKELVKDYCPDKFDEFFRGEKDELGEYIPKKAQGYTAYVLGDSKKDHVSLLTDIAKLFEDIDEIAMDKRYQAIEQRLDKNDGDFLKKLRIRDNGAIPHQLHLEEMRLILSNQGRYYPFLLDDYKGANKIESLLTFRIPYYVGPLNSQGNPEGSRQFAWSTRKEGKEEIPVRPWNFDEIIDKDATAEEFIMRMTGTCTYLYGEKTLPRHSLLYEEFTVLNELNGVRWNKDGENFYRFDAADREGIIEDIFRKRKKVSIKAVSDWLLKRGFLNTTIKGTQGETAFESKLDSYNDFCRILEVPVLDEEQIPMVEELIRWVTLFEDKDILRQRILKIYGDSLTEQQVNAICKLRYSGWGRLSETLLSKFKAETDGGLLSIMDILRYGNPDDAHPGAAMTLQEVLTDKKLGFNQLVTDFNREHSADEEITLDTLPGSPAIKRAIRQACGIVDEIVKIAGSPPAKICVEVTRSDDIQNRGKRTTRRLQQLEEAYKVLAKEDPAFIKELRGQLRDKKNDLASERVMLYFAQGGKCLYSGEVLRINNLSHYQVDHILPRVYIKDDSLDNKALVTQRSNQRKADSLLLDDAIIRSQMRYWQDLRHAKLISEKKFHSLTRREISSKSIERFINRQLTETSQAVKLAQRELFRQFPETEIVPIKAEITSGIRDAYGILKVRDLNDYHHAHDAYLACQINIFMEKRYPQWSDGRYVGMMRRFVQEQAAAQSRGKNLLGAAPFIVQSFGRDGFDKETGEIFRDTWDGQETVARIRKHIGRKDCFISRRTEVSRGAFWDETVYSPRDNPIVPLKANLDMEKYGGYKRIQFACFIVFVATNQKGEKKTFFEGLPIYLAHLMADPEGLRQWAESIAQEKKCRDAAIVKKKGIIPKGQKIILDGDEFYITGAKEARPAMQPAYSSKEAELLASIFISKSDAIEVSKEDLVFAYDLLSGKLEATCGKLSGMLDLSSLRDAYLSVSYEEKIKALTEINNSLCGRRNAADLSGIGGSRYQGNMGFAYASRIKDMDLIDTSITGMFERKYPFGI